VSFASAIPVGMKDMGVFEAELIRRVSPSLAAYMSAYGHDFVSAPTLGYRLGYALGRARPPSVRRLSFRIRYRWFKTGPLVPDHRAGPAYVEAVFGGRPMEMARLFHLDRIRDAAQWNRILTAEYVAATAGRGASVAATGEVA